MIGWTHVCLSNLILRKFGAEALADILKKAGFDPQEEFGIQTYYDDAETMKLFRVAAASLVDEMWQLYGEFLVTYACETGWEKMLNCMAENLQEFLDNLNAMHYFIDQIAFQSEMRGPTFKCEPMSDGSLRLHYFSNRQGLYPIVKAVLERTQERRKSGMVDHVMFSIELDEPGEEKNLSHRFRKVKNRDAIIEESEMKIRMPIVLRDFNRIFPYHICFNKQMIVEHVGVHLLNEYGLAEKKAMKLNDLVQIVQPSDVQLAFKNILAYMNTLFIFQMKLPSRRTVEQKGKRSTSTALNQPLSLKGQMQLLNGGNSIILLCSPHVTTVRNVLEMNLFISDMPMHDATRDLVMLNQSRICQMELNKRLEETSKKMKGFAEELEKKKVELDNILFEFVPVTLANSLRQQRPVPAKVFSDATVLFSDIPDFIAIPSQCKPSEVVKVLTDVFHRFDRLIELHKVYKVLSLTDTYLIVGGVPNQTPDYCESILHLALGMVYEARQVIVPNFELPLRIRIGIACGTVVGGIVSHKKPRYCLLGDTVVTAKLICGFSDAGKILVANNVRSSVTKNLQCVFVFSSKGYVDAGPHKTLTHYLEKSEKLSVWQIIHREKDETQTIDGYKELQSKEGMEKWDAVRAEAIKQIQVHTQFMMLHLIQSIFARTLNALTPSTTSSRAFTRIRNMQKTLKALSNRSDDSGISESSETEGSAVCTIQ